MNNRLLFLALFAPLIVAVQLSMMYTNPLVVEEMAEPTCVQNHSKYPSVMASPSPAQWALEKTDKCFGIIRQFHQLSSCYRSFDGSACSPGTDRTEPLYNFGLYHGQGFGRVIEHAVNHCILALSLNRPCVFDLQRRDPYYAFRSFLNVNTYNWNPDIANAAHGKDIDDAISKLPANHHGGWNEEDVESGQLEYENIYPMTVLKNISRKDYTEAALKLWNGKGDTPIARKMLLSPNWGDAWFTKVKSGYNTMCSTSHMKTLIQNALFGPTDLTKMLFKKRCHHVLPDGNESKQVESYGAIHLRTYFLRNEGRSTEDMIGMVRGCIAAHPQISLWWLVSDDIDVANNVTAVLSDKNIVHGYHDKEFNKDNTHSGTAGKTEYGQKLMAPHVLDWMVLHESEMAIVSPASTFSETGARGNGKIKTGECAKLLVGKKGWAVYSRRNQTN